MVNTIVFVKFFEKNFLGFLLNLVRIYSFMSYIIPPGTNGLDLFFKVTGSFKGQILQLLSQDLEVLEQSDFH